MITVVASGNTVLQIILEEDKRGRVMSFFTMSFMGMIPFGSLTAGAMADWVGPRDTLLLSSGFCIIGAILFAFHLPKIMEMIRPIYVRMRIIKEGADGPGVIEKALKDFVSSYTAGDHHDFFFDLVYDAMLPVNSV